MKTERLETRQESTMSSTSSSYPIKKTQQSRPGVGRRIANWVDYQVPDFVLNTVKRTIGIGAGLFIATQCTQPVWMAYTSTTALLCMSQLSLSKASGQGLYSGAAVTGIKTAVTQLANYSVKQNPFFIAGGGLYLLTSTYLVTNVLNSTPPKNVPPKAS